MKIKYLFMLIMFFISLSSAFNVTEQQKEDICGVLNLSFFRCYSFWSDISTYSLSNCTNETEVIYVNHTIYVNQTLSELDKIDEYQKRGFEPVFEGGIIVNFRKPEVEKNTELMSIEECDIKISDEMIKRNSLISARKKSFFDEYFIYIIISFIILLILYKFGILQKYFKKYSDTPRVSNLFHSGLSFSSLPGEKPFDSKKEGFR
jgi:hypothetical protein